MIQLYVSNTDATVPAPIRSLAGIKKVNLKPNEEQTVEFIVDPQQMAVFYDNGNFMVEPGFMEISVGGGQPGLAAKTTMVLSKKVEVTGNPYLVEQ